MKEAKRVLVKMSGEALAGASSVGVDGSSCLNAAKSLLELHQAQIEVGVVLGGGNFFRGLQKSDALSLPRSGADQVGMLATMMNGLILQQTLQKLGCEATVFGSVAVEGVIDCFNLHRMQEAFKLGHVVIFVGGTGHPYFTTDTAAALRASEMEADLLLKATMQADAIYNKDPRKHADATAYQTISYQRILDEKLTPLDLTATTLCMTNEISIKFFNFKKHSLLQAVRDHSFGTLVNKEG